MASIAIQFHATLNEVEALTLAWLKNYGVHAALLRFPPFEVTRLKEGDLAERVRDVHTNAIAFLEQEIDCQAQSRMSFVDGNEGLLTLDIGHLGPRGLEQCRLSTLDARPLWRKIASDLKRNTTAGAIGIHEGSGATARYRSHRFTVGASSLHANGISLRPFAQSPVILRPIDSAQ